MRRYWNILMSGSTYETAITMPADPGSAPRLRPPELALPDPDAYLEIHEPDQ